MLLVTSSPDFPSSAGGSSPVFVDESGRRHRRARIVGWVVGAIAALYLALFVVSLVASPGVIPLSLPGVGRLLPDGRAPDISGGSGHRHPAQVVETSSPTPEPVPATTATVPPVPSTTSPVPRTTRTVSTPPAPPSPRKTASPTSGPTATPTTKRTGRPTANPTPRGTGKPTGRPTHGGGRPATSPSPTPS